MQLITQWYSIPGMSIMTLVVGLLLYRRSQYEWLRLLISSVPGGMLLNVALKQVFHRARPQFDDPLVTLGSYSFPSGHTTAATLFYGFLTLLQTQLPGQTAVRRRAIVVGAMLMVLLVATSRVYLGAHHLSDVSATMLEGALWSALSVALLRVMQRHRAEKPSARI